MDRSHSQSMIDCDTNMDQLQSDYKLNAGKHRPVEVNIPVRAHHGTSEFGLG